MEFKLIINMDNAAFGENDESRAEEIALILEGLASRIRHYSDPDGHLLADSNGNNVGMVNVTPTPATSIFR